MVIDSSAQVHQTAIIAKGASIGAGCLIGPYSLVGADVTLGENVELKSHVVVEGTTTVGAFTSIFPFASIGHKPQDLKFGGESSELIIGARNTIRESVTMNPGTTGGGLRTVVGDDNLFMVNVHVGHDCRVGNGNVLANNVSLAGHVVVEDNVVIGGHCGIHQFCRIGSGAMIGVLSAVLSDVIPYGTVTGDAAKLSGLNLVGLKRRDAEKAQINGLRSAYREIFKGEGTLKDRAELVLQSHPDNPLVKDVCTFILSESDRSFCQPERK